MSEIRIGMWIEKSNAGSFETIGRIDKEFPHSSGSEAIISTTGTSTGPRKSVTVPTTQTKMLWDYNDDARSIEFATITSDQTGVICLYVDEADPSDGSPAGTSEHWYYIPCANLRPCTIGGYSTLAKATGVDPTSDNSGVPSLPSDGSKVTVKVFKIAFYNPQTDSAVVDVAIFE